VVVDGRVVFRKGDEHEIGQALTEAIANL
jgi:hypothetical protein